MEGNGGFGFGGKRAAPIYGGKIWTAVTEFIPPRFRCSAPAHVISRGGSAVTRRCRFLRRRGWLARNDRSGRSSRAWPEGALRVVPCDNAGEPRQPNGPKIAPPMRAKGSLGYQTRALRTTVRKISNARHIWLVIQLTEKTMGSISKN
jgi:hypothetical protein